MFRFTRYLTLGLALLLTGLVMLAAQPGEAMAAKEAKDSKIGGRATDLSGIAFNFGAAREDAIVFLTNTNPSEAIRAVITAHDMSGTLVGCGVKVLKPSEQGIVYILTSARADIAENVLNINVLGVSATGTLFGKLSAVDGMTGVIAQVDQSTGQTHALVPLTEVTTSQIDRQSTLDECLGPAAVAARAVSEGNIVSTLAPDSWSKMAKRDK